MKRSVKKLLSFTIRDPENNKGRIKDFLFDEEKWVIRYMVVDLGPEFIGKRVLISNQFLDQPDWGVNTFPIKKRKSDISRSPGIDDKLPVSRKYEEELNKHYKTVNYWEVNLPSTALHSLYPPRPLKVPTKQIDEKDIDSSLRSFIEVNGYEIEAQNKKVGNIVDLIVDEEDWQVVYAVIDTSKWMPWSQKVAIPITLFDEISYKKNQIFTKVDPNIIKKSPSYDEGKEFTKDYEVEIYDHFIVEK